MKLSAYLSGSFHVMHRGVVCEVLSYCFLYVLACYGRGEGKTDAGCSAV